MQLRGKIYVVNVFCGTVRNRWNLQSANFAIQQLTEAENWICDEAKRYGVQDLCFCNISFHDVPGGCDVWRYGCPKWGDEYATEYRFYDEILRRTFGWSGGTPHYCQWIRQHLPDADKVVLMLHLGNSGRCHAFWGVEYPIATVYATNKFNSKRVLAGTYAHELLHIAGGARDLYKRRGYPAQKSRFALEHYGDSIMVDDIRPLSKCRIDEVTAWRIGFAPKRQPWFDWL